MYNEGWSSEAQWGIEKDAENAWNFNRLRWCWGGGDGDDQPFLVNPGLCQFEH